MRGESSIQCFGSFISLLSNLVFVVTKGISYEHRQNVSIILSIENKIYCSHSCQERLLGAELAGNDLLDIESGRSIRPIKTRVNYLWLFEFIAN